MPAVRLASFLELQAAGLLDQYGHLPVVLKVVPKKDLLRSYAVDGRSAPHKLINKLSNRDLGFSGKVVSFLQRTAAPQAIHGVNIITKYQYPAIAKMVYSISDSLDPKSLSYAAMCRLAGGKLQALADLTKEEFKMHTPRKYEDELVKSINFAMDVMVEVISKTDLNEGLGRKASLSKIGGKITSNSSLFSVLAWDHFIGGPLTAVSAKSIAQKLVAKADLTIYVLPMISGKQSSDGLEHLNTIIRTDKTVLKIGQSK